MLPMHDTTDIADRLRELADDIENDGEDLPNHDWDLVKQVDVYLGADVYVDSDGDVWFFDDDGYISLGGGPSHLRPKELRRILAAAESVSR